ncbi:MAG: hypothetical protein DWH78_10745 [Planctomycetota bacterium]|nr:MAG: hypothetical protein DWH78_10745 [Planctomycetota bacterium]
MSYTGAMAGMMGMGDPSILYNAAKQYAIDVGFAGVAKTAADGASTVAFVTSERPADTTRDRTINTADNALAVARANAAKAQALRDADHKANYLRQLATENATYQIVINGYRAIAEIAKAGAKQVFDKAANATHAIAIAAANKDRTIAIVNAAASYAIGDTAASLAKAVSVIDANEGLTNALAQAEGTFIVSSASAQTTEAKAISSASVALAIGQATDVANFLSSLGSAAVAWTNSVANAVFSVATSGTSVSQATLNVATAWQQFALTSATAESSAASTGMTALITYVTSVATAAKAESDAQADAAEARVIASVGHALTATAEEATAATTAAKAMAGAEAIAEIASALASQAWVQVRAAADLTFANTSIDASLTASNDAVDAVHAYVVASIGVNLIASTSATGFALLREHSAIAAMTTAQKEAINAACTATLANLAADLTGRNASEVLDDPIAIANATNNAAQAVKSG